MTFETITIRFPVCILVLFAHTSRVTSHCAVDALKDAFNKVRSHLSRCSSSLLCCLGRSRPHECLLLALVNRGHNQKLSSESQWSEFFVFFVFGECNYKYTRRPYLESWLVICRLRQNCLRKSMQAASQHSLCVSFKAAFVYTICLSQVYDEISRLCCITVLAWH